MPAPSIAWSRLLKRVFLGLSLLDEFKIRLDLRTVLTSSDLRNSLIEGIEGVILSLSAVLGFLRRYGLALSVWFESFIGPPAGSGAGIAARKRSGRWPEPERRLAAD
jgi:hypothetical protein